MKHSPLADVNIVLMVNIVLVVCACYILQCYKPCVYIYASAKYNVESEPQAYSISK